MAHIPQDARYVDPPSEREVDEDRITEEARASLEWHGYCPSCKADFSLDEEKFLADTIAHAETCDRLRERAIDWLYGGDA